MQVFRWQNLEPEQQRDVLSRPAVDAAESINQAVQQIVETVQLQGDQALKDYALKFDQVALSEIRLSEAAIKAAAAELSDEFKQAVQLAKHNISQFHQAQVPESLFQQTQVGVNCEMHFAAIDAVGLYVPGGTAPLPSTVLMLAVPARIAGCEKVVLCSPPPIAPEILYTAQQCGVDEIYAIGGAQAIAAMAFGSETVQKVDKVFGPGNAYVTAAKQLVSGLHGGAAIDMPAGPSEVLVIADQFANPEFVAADLLSQAEHGVDSQVILLTESAALADSVNQALATQLAALERAEIAKQALEHSAAIIVDSISQAVELSNRYGPEHLIIQTQKPRQYLSKIRHAGSIFVGQWTPESVGDYASGTNHTLPTYGYTKAYSSLGTLDFMKRYTVQELSYQGLQNLSAAVLPIADAEGLGAHANAVRIRLKEAQ